MAVGLDTVTVGVRPELEDVGVGAGQCCLGTDDVEDDGGTCDEANDAADDG